MVSGAAGLPSSPRGPSRGPRSAMTRNPLLALPLVLLPGLACQSANGAGAYVFEVPATVAYLAIKQPESHSLEASGISEPTPLWVWILFTAFTALSAVWMR